MAGKQKFTAEQIIEACEGTSGIMALVAQKLGCDRTTVWRYARRYKTVREALFQADEAATDMAEAVALKMIKAEHWPAVKHRLDTKGKGRGYTQRTETEVLEMDMSKLSNDQLRRIAAGESPAVVMATSSKGGD